MMKFYCFGAEATISESATTFGWWLFSCLARLVLTKEHTMRTITFDFRKGGGSPSEILFGSLTIYGSEPSPNGSGWVVTSETTLPLVNGQATLADALERPVGGGSHYHIIVRDLNSPRASSFRRYLPSGPSPVAMVDLPIAW